MKRTVLDLNARGTIIPLGHATKIMGIVNCTPDSFSGDGHKGKRACLGHACRLIGQGADIIDIGGESTRPGALSVSLKEEISRVIPVIEALARRADIPISVDTTKIEVARAALEAGASIINNVRGDRLSLAFLKVVRDYNAAIVIMHNRGTPANMQSKARYRDVAKDVMNELQISVEKCLSLGIKMDRIIIDPGIGFAKKPAHNLVLINELGRFNSFGCPILLGPSRKSFIGHVLNDNKASRLMGTAAAAAAAAMHGAHIIRVHDVKAVKEALMVTDAILNAAS